MSMYVDPTLVAGFAAEVRSHLPEVRQALARFEANDDGDALETARSRLSSMRDASTVVGLEPLGRALDAFVSTLRPPGPRAPLMSPLALLDHYLDELEEGRGAGVEPSLLLQELETLDLHCSTPRPTPGSAPTPRSDLPPQAGPESADGVGAAIPKPGWLSRGGRPAATPQSSPGPSAAVRQIFAAEAEEHAQAISRHLGQLRPGEFQREALAGLRRRMHNLKGSAALVHEEQLSRIAHGAEDLLDHLYDHRIGPDRAQSHALQLAGDALQSLIHDRRDEVDTATVLATLASSLDHAPTENPRAEPEPTTTEEAETPAPTTEAAAAPEEVERRRFVRISVDDLDEIVRSLVEIDAERHRLKALIASQGELSTELDLAERRLHQGVRTLEGELEVVALGGGAPVQHATAASTFDALELDRYTDLHERSRALIESSGDLETVRAGLGHQLVGMQHSISRLETSTLELRHRLLGLRLVPFKTLASRLEGVLRLAARSRGKAVDLQLDDGGVELDKDVLDALVDPLDHLLRNAVAHGIEDAEARRGAGKRDVGTVHIVARYSADGVQIEVGDDGAGLDLEAVARRAVEREVVSRDAIASWDEDRLRELVFVPGLSTAGTVDRIAGRGVGLDVVRQQLSDLRGRIAIDSNPGRGTTVRLEMPTSLAVQRVLLVRDGGHRLAIPSAGVENLERIRPERIESLGEREVLRSGETTYTVLRLATSVGLPEGPEPPSGGPERLAIYSRLAAGPTAILVESILEEREVVVQDLGRHLRRLPGLLGVTQTGSGHPVPILDPASSWRGKAAGQRQPVQREQTVPGKQAVPRARSEASRTRPQILVVDDSLSMRRYLSQLVQSFGYEGIEAKDGQDALERLAHTDVAPDLILLDLEMPRLDGFELMESLASDPRFGSVPRVVLSSRGAEKHRRRAFEAGAKAYLVKPVTETELESTLENQLAGGTRDTPHRP